MPAVFARNFFSRIDHEPHPEPIELPKKRRVAKRLIKVAVVPLEDHRLEPRTPLPISWHEPWLWPVIDSCMARPRGSQEILFDDEIRELTIMEIAAYRCHEGVRRASPSPERVRSHDVDGRVLEPR
jgi:hypothetical protein